MDDVRGNHANFLLLKFWRNKRDVSAFPVTCFLDLSIITDES